MRIFIKKLLSKFISKITLFLKFYSKKVQNENPKYEYIDSYKNELGENVIVAQINDSFGKRFKSPVMDLILKRKHILAKFSIDDIINIVGLASTEKPPIVIQNKTSTYKYFSILAMLFGAALITSNIASSKLTSFFGIIMTGGTIPYAFTYSLGDIITEVYGYKRTRQLIWGAVACNIFVIIFIFIAIHLTPAPSWTYQEQYKLILGATMRIIGASLCSYWCSEFLNSYVLARLKIFYEGKYLWQRLIFSSLVSITSDTVIFTLLAYFGTLSLIEIMSLLFVSYSTSIAWELVVLPLSVTIISYLKKIETLDIFDTKTNFTPFSLDISYRESDNKIFSIG